MDDLRVVDVDEGLLSLEVPDEGDGGGLASIACVSLERETEDGNALQGNISIKIGYRCACKVQHTLPVMVLKRVSTTLFEKRFF